jgi:hypothetical protein
MARMSYVFGDALTGSIIQEIDLQGVSMTRALSGIGEFRGSFGLDQSGKDNRDLIAATEPGRCFIISEREDQPIWGGIVWARTYQSQSKTFELFCTAYENYPSYRIIRDTFDVENTEQRNMFLSLWTAMMADPNSLQFTLPATFPDVVLKSLKINDFEYKTFRSGMDYLADAIDGFDWTIDISRSGGVYTRTLRIGYPKLGSTDPVAFDYSGQILNYWQTEPMRDRATHFYGLGAGEGSNMLTSTVIHNDLISSGFPRYDTAMDMSQISDLTILTSLTTQIAISKKPTVPNITIEFKGDLDPVFGGYGLGDAAVVYFDDGRHADPVDRVFNSRILGWEYYPASSERIELVRVVFEGRDFG